MLHYIRKKRRAPHSYAFIDPATKTAIGGVASNTLYGGRACYVYSSLSSSSFYVESDFLADYVAVGFDSSSDNALLVDSYGGVYLRDIRVANLSTAVGLLGLAWNGVQARFYNNGVLGYTSAPNDLPPGPRRILMYSNGGAIIANLGATPFTYPVPAGFNAGLYE